MDSHTPSASCVQRLEIVETTWRRRCSEDEKLWIVLESLARPRLVSATARRHGLARSQLLTWRRAFAASRSAPAAPGFLPAMVVSLQMQEALGRDLHAGDLYVFRRRRGDLIKCLWHDGLGLPLYAKRLEKGRFLWPSPAKGAVAITPAQLGYLLEGIDWRHPQRTWQQDAAG